MLDGSGAMAKTHRFLDRKSRKHVVNLPLLSERLGITDDIKSIAADDLKHCRYSREEVALALSGQVGREITVTQINAWVAESHIHRFPLDVLPAWVRVTGSPRILEMVCGEAAMYLAGETEHRLAAYGRRVIELEKATAQEAKLKADLLERL